MTFWKVKVPISDEGYYNAVPVIYCMRLMGIFPIAFHRDDLGKMYMQWSPLYAIYSYGLGLYLQSTVFTTVFNDLLEDPSKSIRVRSRTDIYVNFGDVTITQTMTTVCIFLLPAKFLTFFAYMKCINEVDALLLTKHSKWEKLYNFLTFYGFVFTIVMVLLGDCLIYIATLGDTLGVAHIIKTYLIYYITCLIMITHEYDYQYLADNLTKRIKRMNDIFKTFNLMGNQSIKENVYWKIYNKKPRRRFPLEIVTTPNERIGKLMKAYMKLVDAAGQQSNLLGQVGTVAVVVAFCHLTVASYFLFSELGGKRHNPVYLSMKVFLASFHVGRLLLVTEPWYACCMEVETTKNWVCKLHYSKFGHQLRKKLRTFQLILGLRPIQFSLSGFAIIDRALITSLFGAVATYVVILLQYQAKDEV